MRGDMNFAERSFGPLAVVLVLSFVGCGGSTKFEPGAAAGSTSAAAGSTSAGGASSAGAPASAGGSGGTASASGGAGGAPIAAGGSSTGGSSTGGAPNGICALLWMEGDCEGAIPKYWHNPATGQCERRTYGGCGGNANRFDTPEQCVAACGGVDPNTYCTQATDCLLRSPACCGDCEPVNASSFV